MQCHFSNVSLQVVYRRQVFQSKEEFIEAYNNGTLNIEPESDPTDLEWSTRKRVGLFRDLDHLSGPRMVSFSGPRFRVDKEQRYVSWMGWEFYMGFGVSCDKLKLVSRLTP